MTVVHFTTAGTFMLSITGLALHRTHLVSALLCIEGMMLALFSALAVSYQTPIHTNTSLQPIIMLALAACGAGAGLSLLVASTRTHASDHLHNLSLLKC
ncbi:NADH dehydrogenase subunit 4L (mitochondrion) [Gekko japonicus]|uniref:NADH-ubiquinone oxidoreductase chain 4L n=1 Tax=Gekko japonicus TaxID=146911 RepID=A0A0U2H7Z2_GEKJA|nr:NADH dehydrogenase subunit 4L [Gekko japonicus]ALE66010.1 NADH dehydrogenase subunit 4L [Gekko japonicus]AMW90864.1 NADH dehydrogenase subunit 4L [Gekko japonicus]